jgi:hypothetical protein
VQKEELSSDRLTLKLAFKTYSRDFDGIPLVLGQDRVRWRAVVEIIMTFDIHKSRKFS